MTLTNEEFHLSAPGATFAGRDIFAPVAAKLCSGIPLDAFGELIDPVTLLPGILPLTRDEPDGLHGEVLWVDRFGNAQLNIDPSEIDHLGDTIAISWGGRTRTAKRADTYAAIKGGDIGLVVDSYGLVSVCLDQRNASIELGLGAGAAVRVHPAE